MKFFPYNYCIQKVCLLELLYREMTFFAMKRSKRNEELAKGMVKERINNCNNKKLGDLELHIPLISLVEHHIKSEYLITNFLNKWRPIFENIELPKNTKYLLYAPQMCYDEK